MCQTSSQMCRFNWPIQHFFILSSYGIYKVFVMIAALLSSWAWGTLFAQKCFVIVVAVNDHITFVAVKYIAYFYAVLFVGHPWTYLKLQDFVLFGVLIRGSQIFGSFFTIIPQIFPSRRRNGIGQTHIQSPHGEVGFMNSLVTNVAVAIVPKPVPVVVHIVFAKGLFLGWALPQIPV